jgi:hypothetical protein
MAIQERMVADSLFSSGTLVKDGDTWKLKGSDGKLSEMTPGQLAEMITKDWDQDKWQSMMDESLLQAWQNEFEYLADYHKQFSDEMDATIKRKQEDQALLDKYESGEAMTKDEKARVDALIAQYGNVDAASMALAADMDQCAGAATRLAEAMSLGLVPVVGTLVTELSKIQSTSTEIAGATTEAEATEAAQAAVGPGVTLGEYQLMGDEYVRYSVTEDDGKYYLRKDVVRAEDVIDVSDEDATYTYTDKNGQQQTHSFSNNDTYYQDAEADEQMKDAGFSKRSEQDSYIAAAEDRTILGVDGKTKKNLMATEEEIISSEMIARGVKNWNELSEAEQEAML